MRAANASPDLAPSGLSALYEITCPSGQRTLRLGRSWPRAAGHLLLEYHDGASTVVGQWFADAGQRRSVARDTPVGVGGTPTVVVEGAGVVLHGLGADRRLPALASLLCLAGCELVVHRPERRAVVRRRRGSTTTYHKLVRPGRTPLHTGLAGVEGVQVPAVVSRDDEVGVVELTELPGRSLHEVLADREVTDADVVAAFGATGVALRALHDVVPWSGLARHDATSEYAVTRSWADHALVHRVFPDAAHHLVHAALARLGSRLAVIDSSRAVGVVHRDLHDKQVLVKGNEIGLLDLDTLAVGSPALDLANLLVHLQLRVAQSRCEPKRASAAAAALIDQYRPAPGVLADIDAYAMATRLRLACVYAFRPRWQSLALKLLDASGAV